MDWVHLICSKAGRLLSFALLLAIAMPLGATYKATAVDSPYLNVESDFIRLEQSGAQLFVWLTNPTENFALASLTVDKEWATIAPNELIIAPNSIGTAFLLLEPEPKLWGVSDVEISATLNFGEQQIEIRKSILVEIGSDEKDEKFVKIVRPQKQLEALTFEAARSASLPKVRIVAKAKPLAGLTTFPLYLINEGGAGFVELELSLGTGLSGAIEKKELSIGRGEAVELQMILSPGANFTTGPVQIAARTDGKIVGLLNFEVASATLPLGSVNATQRIEEGLIRVVARIENPFDRELNATLKIIGLPPHWSAEEASIVIAPKSAANATLSIRAVAGEEARNATLIVLEDGNEIARLQLPVLSAGGVGLTGFVVAAAKSGWLLLLLVAAAAALYLLQHKGSARNAYLKRLRALKREIERGAGG